MSEAEAADKTVPATAAQRPGRTLADARAAKGMTVAEVAAQLKLSASQVEALEADDYDRLPGPVFVRGFVRNYARLLELAPEKLADSVDLPHAPMPASTAIPVSREIPFPAGKSGNWLPYATGLAVLVGTIVVYELFYAPPHAVTVSVTQPVGVPPDLQPASVSDAVPAVSAVPAVAAGDGPPVEATEAVPQTPPVTENPEVPVRQVTGMAEVHFAFAADSWVEVRDRNERVLFSQLNPGGSEQRVTGRPPLSVVIGNARGVRLTYNGAPFDLVPHTRVEVARFTLE
ncbi:MAG: helix-turn-helix domain-containing protein [Burkholderiales bacterium]|nr:helix-turn-helix domain-containing protein [Burkholderiales bacterium]